MNNIGCEKCKSKEYQLIKEMTISQVKIELRLCSNCPRPHLYRVKIVAGIETYFH